MHVVNYIEPDFDMRIGVFGAKVESVVHYRFDNGYGASVVQAVGPDGEPYRELAVLHGGDIVYDTPITGDVLPWLDEAELLDTLQRITRLPERAS